MGCDRTFNYPDFIGYINFVFKARQGVESQAYSESRGGFISQLNVHFDDRFGSIKVN